METVLLKVNKECVKVVSESGLVLHSYKCKDLSVKGLLSKLNKEVKKYNLENYYVEDVQYTK